MALPGLHSYARQSCCILPALKLSQRNTSAKKASFPTPDDNNWMNILFPGCKHSIMPCIKQLSMSPWRAKWQTLLGFWCSRRGRCFSRLSLLGCFFDAQTYAALAINFQNFNRYFLAHLQVIGHFLNALVSDLRDVYQTFFTATDGNERAKVNDTGHFTAVDT